MSYPESSTNGSSCCSASARLTSASLRDTATDQDLAEASGAREALLGKRRVELLLGHQPISQQERAENRSSIAVSDHQGRFGRARFGRNGDLGGSVSPRISSVASNSAALASACSNVICTAASMDAVIASGAATAHRTRTPRTRRMSSRHASLPGSATATSNEPSGKTRTGGPSTGGQVLGEPRRHGADRVGLIEVDVRELVLLGDESRDLRTRDHATFHEGLTQPLTRDPAVTAVTLVRERGFELCAADEAVTDQQHAESRPGCRCRSFHPLRESAHLAPRT